VQIHEAKLGKKDGRRAQNSSIGNKLLNEIQPSLKKEQFKLLMNIEDFFKYNSIRQ
jgi:hypothetical protein